MMDYPGTIELLDMDDTEEPMGFLINSEATGQLVHACSVDQIIEFWSDGENLSGLSDDL